MRSEIDRPVLKFTGRQEIIYARSWRDLKRRFCEHAASGLVALRHERVARVP